MADLTWNQVLIIGGVASLAFMLISFGFSGLMAKKGWTWQVKSKPKKKAQQKRPRS